MNPVRQFITQNPISAASIVTVLIVLFPVVAWLQRYSGNLTSLTMYELFPLLGLVAFSCMLAHVAVGTLGGLVRLNMERLHRYYQYTGYVVLTCILLHPGLFVWRLYQDGYGFPPGSYLQYVESGLRVFVLLGSISFVIFLLYELKRKLGHKPWWYCIERASDVALILVFVHGLYLGSSVQSGWFRVVWILYGVLLVSCLLYGLMQRRAKLRAS